MAFFPLGGEVVIGEGDIVDAALGMAGTGVEAMGTCAAGGDLVAAEGGGGELGFGLLEANAVGCIAAGGDLVGGDRHCPRHIFQAHAIGLITAGGDSVLF